MFHRVKSENTEAPTPQQAPQEEASEVIASAGNEAQNAASQKTAGQAGETTASLTNSEANTDTPEEENTSMEDQDTTAEDTDATEAEETETSTPAEPPVAGYAQRAAQIPGSYASYTAPTAPGTAASEAEESVEAETSSASAGNTLTIGEGISMSGEIGACEHLIVEGSVEAALKGARVLDIAESGTFYGSVEIEEATIAGRFEGEITVNGRLTVRSGGVITGSIAYKELEVESGAVLDGRLAPVREGQANKQGNEKLQAGRQASQMAKPKQAETAAKQNVANNEGALFAAAKA